MNERDFFEFLYRNFKIPEREIVEGIADKYGVSFDRFKEVVGNYVSAKAEMDLRAALRDFLREGSASPLGKLFDVLWAQPVDVEDLVLFVDPPADEKPPKKS